MKKYASLLLAGIVAGFIITAINVAADNVSISWSIVSGSYTCTRTVSRTDGWGTVSTENISFYYDENDEVVTYSSWVTEYDYMWQQQYGLVRTVIDQVWNDPGWGTCGFSYAYRVDGNNPSQPNPSVAPMDPNAPAGFVTSFGSDSYLEGGNTWVQENSEINVVFWVPDGYKSIDGAIHGSNGTMDDALTAFSSNGSFGMSFSGGPSPGFWRITEVEAVGEPQ